MFSPRTSLMVQWLRIQAFYAGGPVLIPGQAPRLTLLSRIGSALGRLENGSGTDVYAATLVKPGVNSLLSDRIVTWVTERLQVPISLHFPIA